MQTKPCFYIHSWQRWPLQFLEKISSFGWPVLVHAEDLQGHPDALEIMDLFQKEQLHILSFDVDEQLSPLKVALKSCEQMSLSPLVLFDQHSEKALEQVKVSVLEAKETIGALTCISESPSNSPFKSRLQGIMLAGGVDYRELKKSLFICPVKECQEVQLNAKLQFNKTEIILHFLKKKSEIKVVFVKEIFTKYRISFKEKLQFIKYDFYLTFFSVLNQPLHPFHSSVSLALGVFIACSPFYGLQTILILVGVILFRLSFPIAFLGSQVSLPPFFFFIVGAQLYVGAEILGVDLADFSRQDLLQTVQNQFSSVLLGWLVVGPLLGALLGGIWFFFLQAKAKSIPL